ncbi:MAG: Regulator protein [Promethearchaeota archaeon]|nr:MAG: Regulator protein [Candidatus Lokiarchaeota archaeon]
MGKIDEVNDLLAELEEKVPDILGSAVIRTNGLLVASSLPSESESNTRLIAAMAAALLGTSKRTAETLYDGEFQSLNLEINKGNLFLINAGRVILVATTKKEPNIGLVTLEMEDMSKKIGNIFKME